MSSPVEWNIKPAEFLAGVGWEFRRRGSWLDLKFCPFCDGGDHRDQHTFAVHGTDGNFICLRSTCGESGSFWNLIEKTGRSPRDYFATGNRPYVKRKKKKGFIYGRNGK